MTYIDPYTADIKQLCERHKVKSLYAFGSVVSNTIKANSDIDLLVEFKDVELEKYADNYFDFKFSLEKILNRQIDLIEEKAIHNPFFKEAVNKQRKLVYGS